MKKLMLVSGYLAVICMALFAVHKILHFPGANILEMSAYVLFSVVFTVLFFLERKKLAESGIKKAFNLFILLTMFTFGLGMAAWAFHCPYGMAMLCVASSFLIIVILMQVFFAFQEKDEAKSLSGHNNAIIASLVLIIFVFFHWIMTPKVILQDFDQTLVNQNKEIRFYVNKTQSVFENMDKNSNVPAIQEYMKKANEVKAQSDSLVTFIRAIGEKMMFLADEKKVSFDSIQNMEHKAYRKIAMKFMTEQKQDSLLQVKLKVFTQFMGSNTNSKGKEVLDLFFAGQDSTSSKQCSSEAGCCDCYCKSIISVMVDFNADVLHIRMLEAETINYLQTMQAKVPR